MSIVTDSYSKYAASALSAASLGRNTFGAFLPLAAYELFTRLGYGWAGSLLGFVGLALSCIPVVLILYGRQIRERSPFMREAGLGGNGDGEASEGKKEKEEEHSSV